MISRIILLFSLISTMACEPTTVALETEDGAYEMASEDFVQTLGEAYLYGYPLVLMDLTKQVTTNIERPHPNRPIAPINQLGHFREFPDHTLTAVVKPNVDTYYSIAWLDLKEGPLVLSMPATERYYVLPFYDAYSNVFASLGTRTTGTGAIDVLITGPDWRETEVDTSMIHVQASTNMVWLLGRIQVNGKEDGATTVKAIQDQMRLVPLSAHQQPAYEAPKGSQNQEWVGVIPSKKIQDLSTEEYLGKMLQLMVDNPPPTEDKDLLDRLEKMGFEKGGEAKIGIDNFVLGKKIQAIPSFVHKRMYQMRANPDPALMKNGWIMINEGIGEYGTDYRRRAYVNFIGLGALRPEDAVYPNCTRDSEGNILEGGKEYVLHFEKNELPPVNAFWSLTAYNEDEFLIENEINRFAVGDRDSLFYNEDGSLDIYIQHDAPSEYQQKRNWLPITDRGGFSLTLRLYWPKESVMNGSWVIPGVVPTNKKS